MKNQRLRTERARVESPSIQASDYRTKSRALNISCSTARSPPRHKGARSRTLKAPPSSTPNSEKKPKEREREISSFLSQTTHSPEQRVAGFSIKLFARTNTHTRAGKFQTEELSGVVTCTKFYLHDVNVDNCGWSNIVLNVFALMDGQRCCPSQCFESSCLRFQLFWWNTDFVFKYSPFIDSMEYSD